MNDKINQKVQSVNEVTTIRGISRSIKYLGKILPLFGLLEVFGEPPVEVKDDRMRVIIVEYKNKHAAYVVSDFMNPQKIVISEFDRPFITGQIRFG